MPPSASNWFNVGGRTKVVLDYLSCSSSMWSLRSCYRTLRQSFSCRSDVVMSCHPNVTSAAEGALRLVGSTFRSDVTDTKRGKAGHLQVFHKGQWGAVCKDKFDYVAARVACKQLGFTTSGIGYRNSSMSVSYRNIPNALDDLQCRGGESKLQYCSRNVFFDSNCKNTDGIILDCDDEIQQGTSRAMTNRIRLSNSNVQGTGVVLLQSGREWESVCDTLFDPAAVAVSCRQLGYDADRSVVLPKIPFSFLSSANRAPATHEGVECLGNETSLFDCSRQGCSSVADVTISCVGNQIPRISSTEKLQIAIAMNDDEEVERLLSSGVSPNTRFQRCCDEYWRISLIENAPALTCATCYGSSGSVSALLSHGASIEEIESQSSGTALVWAAYFGHQSIANTLIAQGANVNTATKSLSTPLHYAARAGNVPIIKMLVMAGANIEARDSIGNKPEDIAKSEDKTEAIAYFQHIRNSEIVRDQFFPAIAIRNATKVIELLRLRVDPNSVVEKCCSLIGAPAISCATCVQSLEIVELFLAHSAMVDKRDLLHNGTALIWASQAGNLQIVQTLIRNGANVDAKTKSKETPLIMAAAGGFLEVAKHLVERGADFQARQENGYTALQVAQEHGHTEVVTFLRNPRAKPFDDGAFFEAIDNGDLQTVSEAIVSGINVDTRADRCCGYFNATALICAVCVEQSDIIRMLLDNGASIDLRESGDNGTALIWAARTGNAAIVKILLDAGADIDAQTATKDTALTVAALFGRLAVVRVLLDNGANYDIRESRGYTARLVAIVEYQTSVSNYIGKVEGFFDAITDGDEQQVRNGLTDGINVDIRNYRCCTYEKAPALICAACSEQSEIVELLLDEGASVDGRDRQSGGTALIWAANKGNLPIVRLLVEAGANVNAFTEIGQDTALHWASFRGHLEVVKYLVQNGANVGAIQSGFSTAASLAADQGHLEIARYLLARS